MKNLLVTVALTLVAVSADAAIQYEFTQKNSTPAAVEPVTDLTARAIVDGEKSRVDFLGGTLYPPGTYVISSDASRKLTFVDPSKEWFTEFDTASVASALGTSNIRIANFKSSFEMRDDRPVIAGHTTEHSRLALRYDITVTVKGIPLTQHVQTDVDTWSTSDFAAQTSNSFLSTMRTGNLDIDRLLDAEALKVQGFPLRQTVTTRAVADLPPSRSQLQTPTSKTIVREMWVSAIRETHADPAVFRLPAGYRRADVPDLPKAATETLSFDPPTK
ncbi:MAG TPA: hypothetical protein VM733_07060 [Thermoanaerobaculia bacterium]|nr:hypothetical protein [Thermoanaerobaculia bacterium]